MNFKFILALFVIFSILPMGVVLLILILDVLDNVASRVFLILTINVEVALNTC